MSIRVNLQRSFVVPAKGFAARRIAPVDRKDLRGPTFVWDMPDGHQIVVYVRRKGFVSGGHYHKGKDPSKNPERLFCVYGKAELTMASPDGENMSVEIIRPGDIMTIYPDAKHWIKPLSRIIILVEYRTTHFDRENPDTYPADVKEAI